MNKLGLVLFAAIVSINANAQMAKVQTAYIAMNNGKLDEAKEAIDIASEHPSSKDNVKTLFYRGNIYLMINGNPEYKHLSPNPLAVAMESYKKCRELDSKNRYSEELVPKERLLKASIFGEGIEYYKKSKFDSALTSFESLLTIMPGDTNVVKNCAYAAKFGKNNPKAILYFNELMNSPAVYPEYYQEVAMIQKEEGKKPEALVTLAKGIDKYPNHVGLMIDELNILLEQGKTKEAIAKLEKASQLDAKNSSILEVLGSAYERNDEPGKAEMVYKKALEINPKSGNANYNLGVIYYNHGAEILKGANALPANKVKEYDTEMDKFKAKLKVAQGFFEKSHEIDPKDKNTLINLKEIYVKTNQLDKFADTKKKLEAIK